MSNGRCKIRMFVIKDDKVSDYGAGFEVLSHEIFTNDLLSIPLLPPKKPEPQNL